MLRLALYKYGITVEQYELLLKRQKGVCAICRRPPKARARLSVDHDHKTKKVRGLLCLSCNFALGHFEDQLGWLKRALQYLQKGRTTL